jgi:MFS family permease
MLSATPGILSLVAVRMLQTAMVAAVMPLVFSSFASDLDGRVIGFLNSSRFAGNALGPIAGTCVLAFSGLKWLYVSIGIMGLVPLMTYAFSFASQRELNADRPGKTDSMERRI